MAHGRYTSVTTGESSEMKSEADTSTRNGWISDVEQGAVLETHLLNTTVHNISWQGVTVTVKDRQTKQPRNLVDNVNGFVEAGEICALMGPSGCGKTTLLNALAYRSTKPQSVSGSVLFNGSKVSRSTFREMSCFVEQEDALIGSLTVRETLSFASRLSTSSSVISPAERKTHIDGLIAAFGLRDQANTLIGTPIRKGISGGQKRRVGVASQLITSPKVLFLDEPTSGLDSAASWEVINYLRTVAKRNNLIVIASIHQPSTSTFNLFDKLLLLSRGKTHYFSPIKEVESYYAAVGQDIPLHTNAAEYLLDLINTDFTVNRSSAEERINHLQQAWASSKQNGGLQQRIGNAQGESRSLSEYTSAISIQRKPTFLSTVMTLLHRSFIKSYRDVVPYGIRIAMYFGLALMMGTVWLRLKPEQKSIIPITNAIFFGSAFMSFMAVAYVPAFLEDRLTYVKEHANGLYNAGALMISNFFIGIPYLLLISLLFSIISYWLVNLRPSADGFFVYLMWLFFDLLAAEGLVVFMTSLFPSFVISLALVAFANGLWMSVGGFLVTPEILNVFYRYVFHYWDYQKWVFEGMMVNEFSSRVFACAIIKSEGGSQTCQCMYETDLANMCMINGQGVLDTYGYATGHMGKNIGIMLAIVLGYRIAAWAVLMVRK